MDIGRNDPCPCGSGKKYKKCCGVAGGTPGGSPGETAISLDYLALNQAIGYRGKIGREREAWAKEYIAQKQKNLAEIERDQIENTRKAGQTITCHEGCANCCTQYILGTLQECDAIVYYLNQHDDKRTDFVRNYPAWRNALKRYEPVFQAVKDAVDRQIREGVNAENTEAYEVASVRFLMLNIPCPFLGKDGACIIHEVRPWNCAKPVATTPAAWCNAATNKNNDKPNVYCSQSVPEEMPYFRSTKALNVMLVHLGVWQILSEGYSWLSGIAGLEQISKESMLEPEIQEVVSKFLEQRGIT
jgi:hypothetical protein